MKYLLLALLLLAPVYALNVSVHIGAPNATLPGEAATIVVSATLDNVSIISFPAKATLTFPDKTTVDLTLDNTQQGSYTTTFYSTLEGKHTLAVTVDLGGEQFTAEQAIAVQKPATGIVINATLRNGTLQGTVQQDIASDYTVEFTPFSTGDLSTKTYAHVCSFSCGTECTFSCPVQEQSGIARFSTKKTYTYTTYLPVASRAPNTTVTYDRITGVNEPEAVNLTTPAEAYTLFGTTLNQIPIVDGAYTFTPTAEGTGTIIIKDGAALATYPVTVIQRTNVQQFNPAIASDGTNSWWLGFVSTEKETLLKLPSDPGLRQAYLLADGTRKQLRWEKGYIVVPKATGWVEVKRAQPAPHATQQTPAAYGLMVGGQGIQRHELAGTIEAIDLLHEHLPTYSNGSTSVLYTHDTAAAVIPGAQGSLFITQPLKTNTEGTIQYSLAAGEETTLSMYTFDGLLMQRMIFSGAQGTRSILFTLPPGSYLAVASSTTNAATGFFVLGDRPNIVLGGNSTITTKEDAKLQILHTIMNTDLLSSRTVELAASSKFSVVINGTDTNNNSLVDVTLAPGERKAFTSTVHVPQGATSGEVLFIAISEELNATATDTIIVESNHIPVYVDADVVSIQGTKESPVAHIQNNDDKDTIGTLYVSSDDFSTQLSVTLKPGMNEVHLPAAGERITVRLQVANDEKPQNNERTREFRHPYSTRLVHVNERLHVDRDQYTIQLPATPGYVLTWYDGTTERTATALEQGATTIWSIGSLPANQEFYAALVPGTPVHENFTILLDNTHPGVTKKGTWAPASTIPNYVGFDYLIDLNIDKTGAVIYAPKLPHNLYAIYMHTPMEPSFANAVPVTIHGTKKSTLTVNQQQSNVQYLGLYDLTPESSIAIENYKTTGFVVADAFLFIPISQLGGLEIVGNSTLMLSATPHRHVTLSTTPYLEEISAVEAPPAVTATHAANTLVLSATTEGNYTVTVHDTERALTIYLEVTPVEFGYEFNATLNTPNGPVQATLAAEEAVAALAATDLQAAGEAAGWTFDAELTLAGKEIILRKAYMPNYTLPLTITPRTDDRTGTLSIFDSYEVAFNGLRAESAFLEDLAEAPLLLRCSEARNGCRAKDLEQIQQLTVGGEYALQLSNAVYMEAHQVERYTKQKGRTDRGRNWNKEEKGNQGTLTLTAHTRFVEQEDGFVPVNNTFVLADGVNSLEDPDAAVEVKDNTVKVRAKLESGEDMITVFDGRSTAALSMPKSVRGRALGNKIVYKGIEQSTDVVYEIETGAVKELYVLHDASAPRAFTTTLTLPDTYMYETPDFYMFNSTSTNTLQWMVWKPFAYDERGKVDAPSSRTRLNSTVVQNGDDYAFTTHMDEAWFTDPARVFPVYIDPTLVSVTFSGSDGGYIRAEEAGFPDDDMFVGEINSNQITNGYLRLSLSSALPATAIITSANFSAGVQDAGTWDAGDATIFGFLNTSDAEQFWADNFRQRAEYNQQALNVYSFGQQLDGNAATTYLITVNSTGIAGLQKILVDDRQTYVTVRAAYDPANEASIEANNDYISWYSGVNCCAVTGTVIPPELNITYDFENDTPQITSLSFNQTAYNTTQHVLFLVNITDASSSIDYAQVTLRNPSAVFTNETLTPSQSSAVVSSTISTTAVASTAINRTTYDFYDDFSIGTNLMTFMWTETQDDAFDVSGGAILTDNVGSLAYATVLPTLDLSNKDGALLTFDYNYFASNEAGDCFGMEQYNGTSWNSLLSICTGNAAAATYTGSITSSQYLKSTFNFRFLTNANNNDDDTTIDNVNLTSWKADREYNGSYTYYNQVLDSVLRNVTALSFTFQLTSYTPLGSSNRSNTKPDLGVEAFNGSAWIDIGTLNLSSIYMANATNTTQRNFSITTSDSTVIAGWEKSKYNRDVRVRAMYMDYFNASAADSISYNRLVVNSSQTGGDVYEKMWSSGTLTVLGLYNATQVYANDTAGNANTTNSSTISFTLYSLAKVTGRSYPGGLAAYPEDVNFTCNVTDSVFGHILPGYNVSVFSNVTGFLGELNTDSSGIVNVTVTINEPTLLTCVISNRLDLFYYVPTTNDSRIVAVDDYAPEWSMWSMGIVNGANLSDGVAVNRTNTTLQVRSYWTDNIGLDVGYIEHNGTGTPFNYTEITFGGAALEDWMNYTFDFSDLGEFPFVGLINVSAAWALDFVPRSNYTTPSKHFYLWGRANLSSITIDPANPSIYETTTITCNMLDWYDIPVVGYSVAFYRNSTHLGNVTTDISGNAVLLFNTSSVGDYTMTCNVTDNLGDYYTLATTTQKTQAMTVSPDTKAPEIRSITTAPTNAVLGTNATIYATLSDAAGISSAYANITLPAGTNTSVEFTGSGTAYETSYLTASEGIHLLRATATDPSLNTNVSAYTHFIVSGKAAAGIRTNATRYNSNNDVDLISGRAATTADLEAGTQAHTAPATVIQVTNISAYMSTSGSCAGTTRTGAPLSNSCRRGGYSDNVHGNKYGAHVLRAGYNGTTIGANEIIGVVMFDLSSLPNDAALVNANIKLTVNSSNSWENPDDLTVYALPSSGDTTLWDTNGPDLSALQSATPEFTVGTITGGSVSAGATITFGLSSAQLDMLETHLTAPSDGLTVIVRSTSGDASEWVNFNSGFHTTGTASDPEIALNYSTPTIDYNSSLINYTDVVSGAYTNITAIRINVTLSGTDLRGSNTSVFSRGLGRMPELRVNIYNGSAYYQKYACDVLTRGIGANTTSGTCSITVRDEALINAWRTAANRDVQLQAINLDNRNEGVDSINWTGITVEIINGSVLMNTANANLTGGNLTLTVERYTGSFTHNDTIYNTARNLTIGELIDLASLWNASAWNASNRAEGTYRAVVRYANTSGSATEQGDGTYIESAYEFTINDTVAPSITNVAPANASTMWGQNSTGLTFQFNASDATGFTNCSIYLNTTLRNTTTTPTNGAPTSITVYNIAQGAWTWHVGCFDNATARNTANSTNWTLYIDNTAPVVSIMTQNNSNFSAVSFNITFNITDNNWTTLTWRAFINDVLNNTGSVANNTATNFTITNLAEGRYNVTIEGRDGSGLYHNRTIWITIDRTAPTATINTASNTHYNTTSPPVNITLVDGVSNIINYTFFINANSNASGQVNNDTLTQVGLSQVPEGNHSVLVQATDQAGNSANSSAIRVIVDLAAPIVALNAPVNQHNTTLTNISFNWTYTDLFSATASCTLYINDVANTTLAANNNTLTNVRVDNFTQGTRNWSVSCRDIAGNTGVSAARNFTVDTTAPVVELITPANTTTYSTTRNVTLTYNVTDLYTPVTSCRLYINTALNQTTVYPPHNTSLNFNLTNISNGAYQWAVWCNDSVDNVGYSENRTFTIDIRVHAQSPADNTVIDRDGVSADPDVLTLVANVSDSQNGSTVTFKANLTSPSLGQTDIVLGSNTTNNSGHATIYFDASSSLFAGNYTWWGEEARSAVGTLKAVLVYGGATLTYNGSGNPNSDYNTSQQVRTHYSIISLGPENASTLNYSYAANVSVNFTQPNTTVNVGNTALYNGSLWNSTYTLASDAEIGLWSITAATNVMWFYRAENTSRNFTVRGFATPLSPANDTVVDRDGVDADPDFLTLLLQIPGATQAYQVNFTANLTDPVIGGQTNIVLGNNTTNASGHALLYYNPNSSMYAGNYTWWGVSGVSYVNGTRRFIVKGGLNATYNRTVNPNSTYFQNDTAIVEANLSSLGPETLDELNATYTIGVTSVLTNTTGTTDVQALTYRNPFWNGTHTILTLKGVGVWNTTVNASGAYWYTNATNRTTTIYGFMNVTGNSNSPSPITAYQSTTTSCTVLDHHTSYGVQNAVVGFYRNGALIGTNATSAAGVAQYTYQVNTTGTHTITCNVTDQLGIYYYAGPQPERNSTLTVNAYPITPVSPANGTTLDRDSVDADPDFTMLNVTVPSYVPDGIMIDFTGNLTDPVIGGQTGVLLGNNTTSSGAAILWFNPNSAFYAGNWTWVGNSTAGYSNGSRYAHVKGALNSVYRNVSFHPNSSYNQTDIAIIEVNVTSSGPETRDELDTPHAITVTNTVRNTSGSSDAATLSYTSPYWNGTHALSALTGVGVWNTTGQSSGTYWYTNTTNRTFIVYGYMNITSNSSSPSTIFAYQSTTSQCRVQDQLTGYDVNGASVGFYRNGTFVGSNTTNASGHAQYTFQINVTGAQVITCNVTNQPAIYYYRGNEPEHNNTVTVNPFPVTAISPANDTAVDRDGTHATTDELLLNVTVPGYVPDGVPMLFQANLTDPSIGGQTDVSLGTNTTSGGYAVLYYNPNSTSYAGNWTWHATNPSAYTNSTLRFVSYGQLSAVFENNTYNPHPNYTINETATIRVNLTSLGPETRDQINTTYLASVNATLTNTTGSTATTALTYSTQVWSGTINLLSLRGVGIWNANASAGANFFFGAADTRNTTVYGYMNITQNTTTPNEIYVYDYTTAMCGVHDQHTQYAVAGANVTFYRQGTFIGSNLTNSSGQTTVSFQTNNSGTFTVTCNVTDQLGIYYYAGDESERNTTLIVNPFPMTPVSPANDTLVDRDGTAADPDVVVLNVSIPASIPSGINITFKANLTDPSIAGQTNLTLGSNLSSGGYVVLHFNPSSSTHYAGNYTWYPEEANGIPNGTRTLLVRGSYTHAFSDAALNPNSTYFQNDSVVTNLNITSSGLESRAELNASYVTTATMTFANTTGSTSAVNNVFNGTFWRNTTFTPLTLRGLGLWNVTAATTLQHFYSVAPIPRNFTVYGYMNVSSNVLSPSTIHAFQSTIAACTVIDEHTGYDVNGASVGFYRNGVLLGTNTTNSSGATALSFQVNTTGSHTITCNVTNQPGIYYYRGREPERSSTLTVIGFPFEPVAPANDSIFDRDSVTSDPDALALNISVPAYVPDGERFEFFANLTDPGIGGQTNIYLGNNTTSSGYAALWFNPNSSIYAGNYTWVGNHSAGTLNGTSTFINKGAFNATFENATRDINENYTQNSTLRVNATLASYGIENAAELNGTYGALVNATLNVSQGGNHTVPLTYNSARWTATHTLLTAPTNVGVWNATVYAIASYFYDTITTITPLRTTTVYGYANVTEIIAVQTIEAYSYLDAVCRVNNQFTNASVAGMNVSFYQNGSLIASNLTNISGHARIYYQQIATGEYAIECNITDDLSIYYYAGDERNQSLLINVTPIFLTPEAPDNGTIVDREDAGFDSPTILLVGRVHSEVPDGANISFYANLTDPSIGGQTNIYLGSNLTNSSYINLTINPNSSLYAGTYTWWMDSSGGDPNGSRTYALKGIANVSYADVVYNPDPSYVEGQIANFTFNVTSFGPENMTQMNDSYAATINFTVRPPTTAWLNGTALYNTSEWNGSVTLTYDDPGTWQTDARVNATYFFPYNNTLRNFSVRTIAYLYIFDVEELYNGSIYAGVAGRYYLNYTNRFNATINGANCSMTWLGTNKNLTQNTENLYEGNYTSWFEGVLRYNGSCEHSFYLQVNATANATIHSAVNTTLDTEVREVASGVRQVTLNVTNNQNYTEHDINVYHFVPQGYTVTYQTTPTSTQAVNGQFTGNSTRWYIPNLTAGQMTGIRYNVTGTNNITDLYEAALEVYTVNTTYVFE